ncbi:hypothetical protein WN944_019986 [Citrus x changshan-huyou]|uniref:Uncharacterized protein n=1 Tax=Citrus x changshan-huyou TaxID=2935761 RepID=A0AAP0LXB8_9ROSI
MTILLKWVFKHFVDSDAAQLEMEENIEMRSSGRPGVRSWVVRGIGGTRDGIGYPKDVELAAYLSVMGPDPGGGL